ncbi:MAG: hypothetical protein H3C36_15850 [Chitinophagaceae bacterium]|nr:hypothetical protein [Chitinophagaceae bacterium]
MILFLISFLTLTSSFYVSSHLKRQLGVFNITENLEPLFLPFKLIFCLLFLCTAFWNNYATVFGQLFILFNLYCHVYKPYTYIVKIPIEEHKTPEKTYLGVGIPFFASKSYLFGSNYLYGRFSVYEDFIVVIIPLEETKVFARSDLESLEEKIWQQRFFIKFRDGSVYTISERQTEFIQFLQKIVQENQDKANAKS